MSGIEVNSPQTAQREANWDAHQIQAASTSSAAYEIFRTEINDIDKNVKDANLRTAYQENLVKALGPDMNTMMIEYLNDPKGGAALKKNGQVSKLSIAEKQAQCDSLSTVDKMMLPQLNLNFDRMKDGDLKDGPKKKNSEDITDRDLNALRNRTSNEKFMADATKPNRFGGMADSLIDPSRSNIFDKMDNSWFSGKDGKISKDGVKDFLKDASKYDKPDRDAKFPPDMLQKMQFIKDNWDSPQVKLMREDNGNGNLTRDSIARGCGYPGGYQEFLQKTTPESRERGRNPVWGQAVGAELSAGVHNVEHSKLGAELRGEIHESGHAKLLAERELEFKRTKLSQLAKQESTQGYWQVADKLLKASPIEGEAALETSRQNVILMRALQKLHAQQGGKLGGHEFLASEQHYKDLNTQIDAYACNHSQKTKDSAETLKKRLEKLRTK